jgi:hypothetical protein
VNIITALLMMIGCFIIVFPCLVTYAMFRLFRFLGLIRGGIEITVKGALAMTAVIFAVLIWRVI